MELPSFRENPFLSNPNANFLPAPMSLGLPSESNRHLLTNYLDNYKKALGLLSMVGGLEKENYPEVESRENRSRNGRRSPANDGSKPKINGESNGQHDGHRRKGTTSDEDGPTKKKQRLDETASNDPESKTDRRIDARREENEDNQFSQVALREESFIGSAFRKVARSKPAHDPAMGTFPQQGLENLYVDGKQARVPMSLASTPPDMPAATNCPPFQYGFLDHANSMTEKLQSNDPPETQCLKGYRADKPGSGSRSAFHPTSKHRQRVSSPETLLGITVNTYSQSLPTSPADRCSISPSLSCTSLATPPSVQSISGDLSDVPGGVSATSTATNRASSEEGSPGAANSLYPDSLYRLPLTAVSTAAFSTSVTSHDSPVSVSGAFPTYLRSSPVMSSPFSMGLLTRHLTPSMLHASPNHGHPVIPAAMASALGTPPFLYSKSPGSLVFPPGGPPGPAGMATSLCMSPMTAASLLPPSLAALTFPAQNWCAKCNASFRMTSDLVYHMRSHHKREVDPMKKKREDKLKCNICGESFRERHHLTRHMTSHQ